MAFDMSLGSDSIEACKHACREFSGSWYGGGGVGWLTILKEYLRLRYGVGTASSAILDSAPHKLHALQIPRIP
jgi:hypothetical protein